MTETRDADNFFSRIFPNFNIVNSCAVPIAQRLVSVLRYNNLSSK